MTRTPVYHLLAVAILVIAFLALPSHLRAVSFGWLEGQAWLSFCGPTASGLGPFTAAR